MAHSLFERNKVNGSSANLSFRWEDTLYITASGTCFGTLTASDFAAVDLSGHCLPPRKPSKELPIHLTLYQKSKDIGAVIHTHSSNAVLWSFLASGNEMDCIPGYTPYLKMRVGTVGLVPYEEPGSRELFRVFCERITKSDAFLLKGHGPVVPGKDIMDAFYGLEELEESAGIACQLSRMGLQP